MRHGGAPRWRVRARLLKAPPGTDLFLVPPQGFRPGPRPADRHRSMKGQGRQCRARTAGSAGPTCCAGCSRSTSCTARAAEGSCVRRGDRRPGGGPADPRPSRTADLDRAAAAGAVTARAHAGIVRLGVTRASSSRRDYRREVGRSLCVSLPEAGSAWGAVAPGRGRRGQISVDRRFVRCVPCGRWAGPSPVCVMSDSLALCERGRL